MRAEAAGRGLAVAEKPDSHDICFIADGDTRGFLAARLGETRGDIVDAATGEVLGDHAGAYAFTVGQRKGLNLTRPAPDGRPRYVLSITPVTNTVTVGPAEALEVSTVEAIVRCGRPATPPSGPVECEVQVRAHGEPLPAVVVVDGDRLTATLRRPVRGVAAGQALVAYRPDRAGDIVLGSATIAAARVGHDVSYDCDERTTAGGRGRPARRPGSARCRAPTWPRRPSWSSVSCPDLPHLPELPARGPGADMIGRGAGLLVDLAAELYAGQWRLAARPGLDRRRALDLLERDLDALTEAGAGYAGPVKVQVPGPWTLAAGLDLPIGGRVLRDHGACRDLAASLAEGVRGACGRGRPPAARGDRARAADRRAVAAGGAGRPGPHRERPLHLPVGRAQRAQEALASVVDAAGVDVVVHCCAAGPPLALFREAGARAVSVDLTLFDDAPAAELDALGEAHRRRARPARRGRAEHRAPDAAAVCGRGGPAGDGRLAPARLPARPAGRPGGRHADVRAGRGESGVRPGGLVRVCRGRQAARRRGMTPPCRTGRLP